MILNLEKKVILTYVHHPATVSHQSHHNPTLTYPIGCACVIHIPSCHHHDRFICHICHFAILFCCTLHDRTVQPEPEAKFSIQ